mgnify:CR=1 FL=1
MLQLRDIAGIGEQHINYSILSDILVPFLEDLLLGWRLSQSWHYSICTKVIQYAFIQKFCPYLVSTEFSTAIKKDANNSM